MDKKKSKDPFEALTNEELIEYAQSIEADTYLASAEAHELCFMQ